MLQFRWLPMLCRLTQIGVQESICSNGLQFERLEHRLPLGDVRHRCDQCLQMSADGLLTCLHVHLVGNIRQRRNEFKLNQDQ